MGYTKMNRHNYPDIEGLTEAERAKLDHIDDIEDDLADAYDSTATYAVGDWCIRNGKLYECITAIATAEPFDSTKWRRVAVAELKSNLTEYVTLRARGGVTKNSYVDYTLDDAYTKYKKVVFVIDGNGIYTPMELYSFLITTAETRVNFYYNNTMVGTLNIKRVNDTKLSISMGNNDSITYAMTIYGVTV